MWGAVACRILEPGVIINCVLQEVDALRLQQLESERKDLVDQVGLRGEGCNDGLSTSRGFKS